MRVLLDTHALIWLYTGNERLSEKTKKIVEENMALVSVDEVVDLYFANEAVKRIW